MTSIVAVARRTRLMSVTTPNPASLEANLCLKGRLLQTGTDGGGAERRTRRGWRWPAPEIERSIAAVACEALSDQGGISNLAIRSSGFRKRIAPKGWHPEAEVEKSLTLLGIRFVLSAVPSRERINTGWVTQFHPGTDDRVSSDVQDATLSWVEVLQTLLGGVLPEIDRTRTQLDPRNSPDSASDINADARARYLASCNSAIRAYVLRVRSAILLISNSELQ